MVGRRLAGWVVYGGDVCAATSLTSLTQQNEIIHHFSLTFNPFKPEFTIVIFIHYKPRIAIAILDL